MTPSRSAKSGDSSQAKRCRTKKGRRVMPGGPGNASFARWTARYFAASSAARISASFALSCAGIRGAFLSSSFESFEGFFSYSA